MDGPFHAIVFGLEVVLFAVLVDVFAVSACFSTVSAAAFYDVARSLVASAVLLVASLVLHTHGAMRPRHFHVLLRGAGLHPADRLGRGHRLPQGITYTVESTKYNEATGFLKAMLVRVVRSK